MAVTGLPEPQEDHASRMCRFARESMDSVNDIINGELSQRLGNGTNTLSLKIGIHSGPVTAGLMRAEKSRFQVCDPSRKIFYWLVRVLLTPLVPLVSSSEIPSTQLRGWRRWARVEKSSYPSLAPK